MVHINRTIKKEVTENVNNLQKLLTRAIDERKHIIYKTKMRKISIRIEKALLLVKEAQQIIEE